MLGLPCPSVLTHTAPISGRTKHTPLSLPRSFLTRNDKGFFIAQNHLSIGNNFPLVYLVFMAEDISLPLNVSHLHNGVKAR